MLGNFTSRFLLIRAGVLVSIVAVAVRRFGFRRCNDTLEKLAGYLPFSRSPEPDPQLAQQIADTVDRATRTTSIYPARCLPRSLVLYYYLQRYGQQPELKLGVQTITGQFRGHAWVECNGRELNEDPPANELFVPFDWTAQGAQEQQV